MLSNNVNESYAAPVNETINEKVKVKFKCEKTLEEKELLLGKYETIGEGRLLLMFPKASGLMRYTTKYRN